MKETEEKFIKFQPPRHTTESDLPDVLHAEEDKFSLDITQVKDSFAWFVDMAEFLKTTDLKCKDCKLYPGCGRCPKSEQKIGFCYEEK